MKAVNEYVNEFLSVKAEIAALKDRLADIEYNAAECYGDAFYNELAIAEGDLRLAACNDTIEEA